jgi:hypothetical protein
MRLLARPAAVFSIAQGDAVMSGRKELRKLFKRKPPLQLDLRAPRTAPSPTERPPPAEAAVRAAAATNAVVAWPRVNADTASPRRGHEADQASAAPVKLANAGPQRARASVLLEERRRNQRVLLQVGVTLEFELDGQAVALNVRTINVSIEGALVLSTMSIPLGTRIVSNT